MAKSKKIRVMLSSRCNDLFSENEPRTLSDIRVELKKEIEEIKIGASTLFEVWINEDTPPGDATDDSWEACLQAVRDCDVLIVLSNGNAGWAKNDSQIGICHAEYMEGLNTTRGKVRLVLMPYPKFDDQDSVIRNKRFQEYVDQQSPFRAKISNIKELKKIVLDALADAVVTNTQRGVAASESHRFDMGQALDWSRLDFRTRKKAMESILLAALNEQNPASSKGNAGILKIAGKDIAVIVSAIPAALSVPAARELIGRPFLSDHERVDLLSTSEGPVHLIPCHRSATETQATSLLGFPDATVVSCPFGIYVADDIQKIQFAFLNNCRDESQTRHAFQRFQEWLLQSGEGEMLAIRATSRAKIVKVIANELVRTKGAMNA